MSTTTEDMTATTTAVEASEATWLAPLARPSVRLARRSCCCAAPPVYQVVMPPTALRGAVELLLCRHHLHASIPSLSAAGAWLYDAEGRFLDSWG